MNQTEFWKNFRLGTELQISGSFIFNSLHTFDRMDIFYFEEDCFELLYNSSVGVERILKIAIILSEHTEHINQQDFERSLITHNHLDLFNRLKKRHSLKFSDVHIHFLQMLSDFYKSSRYDRFGLHSVYNENSSKALLIDFFEKHLKTKILAELPVSTEIDNRMRNFWGRTIGKISQTLYGLIEELASALNIYTYEITYDTKAYKIFIAKDFTFEREKTLRKELLIAFLQNKFDDGFVEFINKIKPIEFESHSANEYIKYLTDIHPKQILLEELETRYEDAPFDKERAQYVSIIGSDKKLEEDDDDYF
ncbi:MAG: hypothetical protein IM638_00860 [Bacteroidetes bacterium]|nr:hypothetical protein [Bacteroidota bacterium]